MDDDDVCWSQGPRIGEDGTPVCKKRRGHHYMRLTSEGRQHRGFKGSGFESVVWGEPLMRLPKNQRF